MQSDIQPDDIVWVFVDGEALATMTYHEALAYRSKHPHQDIEIAPLER